MSKPDNAVVEMIDIEIDSLESEIEELEAKKGQLENLRAARDLVTSIANPPPATKVKPKGRRAASPHGKSPGEARGHRRGGKKAGRANAGSRTGASRSKFPSNGGTGRCGCGSSEAVQQAVCALCGETFVRCGVHNTGRGSVTGLLNKHGRDGTCAGG